MRRELGGAACVAVLAGFAIAVTGCGAAPVAAESVAASPAPVPAGASTPPAAARATSAPGDSDDEPVPAPEAKRALAAVLAPAPGPTATTPTDGLPTDAELEESWARVLLRANPGPFQYVAYEMTARGTAGVASHVRGVMGRRDVITRTELLSRAALRSLLGRLRDLGALDFPHPPVAGAASAADGLPGSKAKSKPRRVAAGRENSARDAPDPLLGPAHSEVPIYELSFRLGGRENTFLVADPYVLADRRYAQFINAVREAVVATAGDIAWHAPTGAQGAEGYLFIDSVPSAQVTVDGVVLPEETPILAYTVAAGPHLIVLESPKHGLRREYKVKVGPGLTTSLEVDLR
ncbi:MAG: hypothetical protein EXR79_14210 [Myxococcales bacterium]|nr:hypothetical protein [Myxococcales bacterium]